MTDVYRALRRPYASMHEAARTEILPRFASRSFSTRSKQRPDDLVTEAERRITADLRAHYPNALIVGEEAADQDETLASRLPDAELAFILDPVEGTRISWLGRRCSLSSAPWRAVVASSRAQS